MSVVLPFNLYASQTGLILEAQPIDASNPPGPLGSPLTAGFSEVGRGSYLWSVQALPTGAVAVKVQLHSNHAYLGVTFALSDLMPPVGPGNGAYTYIVTASDPNGDPVPGVLVSLKSGITVNQAITNSSGVATFNVNAATWTIAAFLSGYTYVGGSVNVTGNGNAGITLTPVDPLVQPSSGQSTIYAYVVDALGNIKSGQSVSFVLTAAPVGSGTLYGSQPKTVSSDHTGLLTVALIQGATYSLKCGSNITSFVVGTQPTQSLPNQVI